MKLHVVWAASDEGAAFFQSFSSSQPLATLYIGRAAVGGYVRSISDLYYPPLHFKTDLPSIEIASAELLTFFEQAVTPMELTHALYLGGEVGVQQALSFASSLEQFAQVFEKRTPKALALYLARWHFTATEKEQLSRLLERLDALNISDRLPDVRSGAAALQELRERIYRCFPSST